MRIRWKRVGALLLVMAMLLTNSLAGYGSALISGAEDQKEVTQSGVTVSPAVTGEDSQLPSLVSPNLSEPLSELTAPKTAAEQSESTVSKTEETESSKDRPSVEETQSIEETQSSPDGKSAEETKSDELTQSDSDTTVKNGNNETTDSQTETNDGKKPTEEALTEAKKETLTYSDDQVEVTATYTEAAKFPAGTEIVVEKIPEDSEEYKKYYAEAQAWVKEKYTNSEDAEKKETGDEDQSAEDTQSSEAKEEVQLKAYSLFDISFEADGEEVYQKDTQIYTLYCSMCLK